MAKERAGTKDMKALIAEFVAMAIFVWSLNLFLPFTALDTVTLASIAFAIGMGIVALAYAIAPVSGGHINPAVTFAFVVLGKMPLWKGSLYITAQCLGAILATTTYGTTSRISYGMLEDLPLGSAFITEVMGSFFLVWTVTMASFREKSIAANIAPIPAPIPIGCSVLLVHLVLVPLTGYGINPAFSLGHMAVAAMAGDEVRYYEGFWIYCIAPFVGALAAAMLTRFLVDEDEDDEAKEASKKA